MNNKLHREWTRSKIAKLNNILLRQNISKFDCDMQAYLYSIYQIPS